MLVNFIAVIGWSSGLNLNHGSFLRGPHAKRIELLFARKVEAGV